MNLLEFCDEFRISHAKAKRMLKRDVLRLDETISSDAIGIRANLASGNPLSVLQLVAMVESPAILLDLGRYASAARAQVESLGTLVREAAPKEIGAYILEASRGDPDACAAIADWLCRIVPAEPVGHAYIAARLLLGVPVGSRQFEAPRLSRALMHCRKVPAFKPWHYSERKNGRNVTFYKKPLDL